ncbi:MAG TPA: hypothetical protein VGM51_01795 [Armatimonadota bacterium]
MTHQNSLWALGSVAAAAMMAACPALADAGAADRPNTVAVELGGRTGELGVQYERALGDLISAGGGVGLFSISCTECRQASSFGTASAYMTLNERVGGVHSFFVSGGATLVMGGGVWAVPGVGVGYRLQSPGGFVMRVSVTLVGLPGDRGLANALWVPWPGLQLGYAF